MTWVVAWFQAVLSSICRLTQVVRIATSAMIVASTTSVQMAIRRLRLSGAAAVTVGAATSSSVLLSSLQRHRPIRVIRRKANDPDGFHVCERGDDILGSDGYHPRISAVPRGLRADCAAGTCGRLARRRLPDGVAARAIADPPVVGDFPRDVHRRVEIGRAHV